MQNQSISEVLSHYHSYQSEFHDAVLDVYEDIQDKLVGLDRHEIDNLFQRIIEPDRTVRFKVEWFDDLGNLQVNRGWRIQFNNCLGPYKGGLRFHPTVNESILKFLGFEQIFKNALTGLPMGGAKGGSDFNPKGKSNHEIRRFCESYMNELCRYIGADIDIPAGDIGVGTREVGYLYGQFIKLTSQFTGVITGKHPRFGGSCGREEATGYGCVYFLEECLENHEEKLSGKRVLLSGTGNVALHCAEKLLEEDATVLTLSDSGGTIYYKDGISRSEFFELKNFKLDKRERLKNFKTRNGEFREGNKPWDIEADIAIPCATQNEVSGEDAQNLLKNGVFAIAEGANMPLDKNALEVIKGKEVIFAPAKAANAGGVAVSGLERSQNSTHLSMSMKEVDKKLRKTMRDIHGNCSEFVSKKNGVFPYKLGANIYAFKKVSAALIGLRGAGRSSS